MPILLSSPGKSARWNATIGELGPGIVISPDEPRITGAADESGKEQARDKTAPVLKEIPYVRKFFGIQSDAQRQ
jgi:hypothetical protein